MLERIHPCLIEEFGRACPRGDRNAEATVGTIGDLINQPDPLDLRFQPVPFGRGVLEQYGSARVMAGLNQGPRLLLDLDTRRQALSHLRNRRGRRARWQWLQPDARWDLNRK